MGRRKKKSAARRSAATTALSLAELSALVVEAERRVKALASRRDELQRELAAVDAELAVLTGGKRRGRPPRAAAAVSVSGPRRGPGRPKKAGRKGRGGDGAGTLTEFIREALRGAESLKLKEIQAAVLSAGYPTKSANLGIIISQRLPDMKDVVKVARGVYALRGSGGATSKKASRKKATRKAAAKKGGRKKSSRKKATRKGAAEAAAA